MTSPTLNALRAVLPLAEAQAAQVRNMARLCVSECFSATTAAHYATAADEATAAVTAARLALESADNVTAQYRYTVRLRVASYSVAWLHTVDVMAEHADAARERAAQVCEAAGLAHGNVYSVELAQ